MRHGRIASRTRRARNPIKVRGYARRLRRPRVGNGRRDDNQRQQRTEQSAESHGAPTGPPHTNPSREPMPTVAGLPSCRAAIPVRHPCPHRSVHRGPFTEEHRPNTICDENFGALGGRSLDTPRSSLGEGRSGRVSIRREDRWRYAGGRMRAPGTATLRQHQPVCGSQTATAARRALCRNNRQPEQRSTPAHY